MTTAAPSGFRVRPSAASAQVLSPELAGVRADLMARVGVGHGVGPAQPIALADSPVMRQPRTCSAQSPAPAGAVQPASSALPGGSPAPTGSALPGGSPAPAPSTDTDGLTEPEVLALEAELGPDGGWLGDLLAKEQGTLGRAQWLMPGGDGRFCEGADPDAPPPGGPHAWLGWLPAPLLGEWAEAVAEEAARGCGPEVFKAGFWDREGGNGDGFACGGEADRLVPGAVLARLAEQTWSGGLAELNDDELVGLLRAGRRLASWAAALELSAAGELVTRRFAQEDGGDTRAGEHVGDEIAAALMLTARSGDTMVDRAVSLKRLPATMRALTGGRIDLPRALVIVDETSCLDGFHAAVVEQAVIADAPGQTTGELRAAVRRAVIAADSAAARARKERAQRAARVERWDERAGTAALAGRDLPPAAVLAADAHISALARDLKASGMEGGMDALRATVFLALLAGLDPAGQALTGRAQPSASGAGIDGADLDGATPAQHAPRSGDSGDEHGRSGATGEPRPRSARGAGAGADAGRGGLAGTVNLTLPLTNWLGWTQIPGEVAGFGPLDADDSRTLAGALAGNPRSRWCLTVTDAAGRAVAHGCARNPPPGAARDGGGQTGSALRSPRSPRSAGPAGSSPGPPGSRTADPGTRFAAFRAWLAEVNLQWLEAGHCTHPREHAAYKPPRSLRHLIEIRQATCSFPGCRRPSARSDLDHTVPYDIGGRTCECNLAPLCRRHHRAKQSHGWHLDQTRPGALTWTTPSRRAFATGPTSYLA